MNATGGASVRDLLREAATWRLLGRLFERPSQEWGREVRALADEIGDTELMAAAQAAGSATEGQYYSVFGPGGPAPPREATYHETVELGSLMSALTGYYAAFAYVPDAAEPPDHVAVEVGFVAYLRLKEAYALAQGDEEHAAVAARAAAAFVADHLAMIAGPLADLLAHAPLEYLTRASRVLAARVGPPPRSPFLPMLKAPNDDEQGDEEFTCASS